MRPQPTLRRAGLADREPVRLLLADLGYAIPAGVAFDRVWSELLGDERRTLLLAELDGRPVGFACFSRVPLLHLAGDLLVLDELVVAAAARGSGVGTALVAEVVREAERIGARRIELTTNRQRESYRRGFYVRRGFHEAGSAVMRIERP
jgi:GNAT superfamily N-acetyltransferase